MSLVSLSPLFCLELLGASFARGLLVCLLGRSALWLGRKEKGPTRHDIPKWNGHEIPKRELLGCISDIVFGSVIFLKNLEINTYIFV